MEKKMGNDMETGESRDLRNKLLYWGNHISYDIYIISMYAL